MKIAIALFSYSSSCSPFCSPSVISQTFDICYRNQDRKATMAPRKARYAHDRNWFWKFIVRLLAIVLASTVIGCVTWALANSSGGFENRDRYGFYGTALVPWGLIPVSP